MAQVVKDVVTWLKQWFPEKGEVVAKSQGSGNASKNVVTDASGDVTLENKVSVGTGLAFDGTVANKINHSNSVTALTTSGLKKIKHDAQGHITETANPTTSDLPNSETYANLGSNLTNQKLINDAINTKIGALTGIEFIVITTNKGTASADTMNKLYVVSENSKVNYYYTKRSGTSPNYTYSWEELDANIVADVSWDSVTGKPSFSTVATSGSYNDLSNKPTIPDVSGKIDTAGTGLSKSGTTINHNDNVTSAQSTPVFKKFSYDKQGHITGTADVQVTDFPHSHNATGVIDANAHSNLGTSANANQGAINTAIDTAIGNKISKSSTTGLVKNDGSIDTSSYITSSDISGKSDKTATIGTTITLVDKGETNEGCIIFNTIS